MRTTVLILLILSGLCFRVKAQEDSIARKKMHRVWISLLDNSGVRNGILFETKESSLVLSSSGDKKDYYMGTFTLENIDARSINKITFFKGPRKITLPVYGQRQNFNKYKQQLTDYSFKNNSVVIRSSYFSNLTEMLTDTDGNVYHTIALGGMVWMAGNLRVSHYRNGESIPEVNGITEWEHGTTGATCMNRKESSDDIPGRLYNWNAVADSRGICPNGWHIPAYSEWMSMINCFGGISQAGKRLTESIPGNSVNISREYPNGLPFGLPCGFRFKTGEFSSGKSRTCQWWSSTPQDSATSKALQLDIENRWIFIMGSDNRSGLPVRCLRD